jgi:hypothetical protein
MATTARRPKLGASFNIGGEAAEADSLLERAFYTTSQYTLAESHDDFDCFLVGRTGSGKSAILRRVEDQHPKHVVRINPEDVSLPYIAAIDIFRYLDSLDVNLDLLWIALWKHVILIEVIKHRYNIDSGEARKNFMDTLRKAVSRDSAKKLALDYLEEFDGKFWAESDERVRQITDGMEKRIAGEISASGTLGAVKAGASFKGESSLTHEEKVELSARFQRIVNDNQLARLNKLIDILDDDILDSAQNFVYVVIDDLDRDWVDDRLSNSLMRCLLRAVLDFQRVQNLKILVALRTNIYEAIDFGTKGAGQEEKIRALVVPIVWERRNLVRLLDERVRVASAANSGSLQTAAELLPHSNATRGNPMEYILDRTLLRPRDAIAFYKECLRQSDGKTQISWDSILQAEKLYSRNRLMALRDEWKGTYPGIGDLFETFQASSGRMDRGEVSDKLDNGMLLLAESKFVGAEWLMRLSGPILAGTGSWEERYRPALSLLYRLGFIAAAVKSSDRPLAFSDNPHLLSTDSNLRQLESFVVTRPYHAALSVTVAR